MTIITHKDPTQLSSSAHLLKTLFNIKFTRAKERHAVAMGFPSSNHLLNQIKLAEVSCDFSVYIGILKADMLKHHQISIDDKQAEALATQLSHSLF